MPSSRDGCILRSAVSRKTTHYRLAVLVWTLSELGKGSAHALNGLIELRLL
jgi:hypothetical protein